jgi:effector-binding domain-containing protein
MRVLKGLLFFIIALVVILCAIGAFLPSGAHVERSVLIDRPPSVVFPLLNSYKRFNEWSPWYPLDPSAKYTYSGPESGVGAKMAWVGNDAVGTGSQTITASEPLSRIATDLDFGEMGVAKVEFKLVPEGQGTRVTWGFSSDAGWSIVGRYFNLMMDKFIGADYEKGLAKLKTLAESLPAVDLSGTDIAVVEVSAMPILYVTTTSTQELPAISEAYKQAYGTILAVVEANGLKGTAPVMGIDNYWDERGYGFDAAIPVDRNDVALTPPVQAGQSYAGRAVRVHYVGDYSGLMGAHKQAEAYIALNSLKSKDRPFTVYVGDPATTPPAELVSDVYYPVE